MLFRLSGARPVLHQLCCLGSICVFPPSSPIATMYRIQLRSASPCVCLDLSECCQTEMDAGASGRTAPTAHPKARGVALAEAAPRRASNACFSGHSPEERHSTCQRAQPRCAVRSGLRGRPRRQRTTRVPARSPVRCRLGRARARHILPKITGAKLCNA